MHGTGACTTRTFPTRCRECGASVFYFSCSCGSKVFFDELGLPWPVHDCHGGAGPNGIFGLDPAAASALVRAFAERTGQGVPALPWEPVTTASPRLPPIVRADPTAGASRTVIGTVREVLPAEPTARRLGVRPGSLLDRQVQRHLPALAAQLTIHEDALEHTQLRSYTCWISMELFGRTPLRIGEIAQVELRAVVVQGIVSVWLAEAVSTIG